MICRENGAAALPDREVDRRAMIYLITHRECDAYFTQFKPSRILHVGLESTDREDYLFDTSGDSIADKNPYFCELTGVYWIWKNGKESERDAVGVEHYHRFFMVHPHAFLDENYVWHMLSRHDIILPERFMLTESVEEQYGIWHRREDLEKLRRLVAERQPEYLPAFERVMRRDWLYPYNMMICRKPLFDQYCSWLFPLLFELEGQIDTQGIEDAYQRRLFGFLGERLLNVWVEHLGLSVAELYVLTL